MADKTYSQRYNEFRAKWLHIEFYIRHIFIFFSFQYIYCFEFVLTENGIFVEGHYCLTTTAAIALATEKRLNFKWFVKISKIFYEKFYYKKHSLAQ